VIPALGGPDSPQLGLPNSNEHCRTPVNITETMFTLEGREMVGLSNNIIDLPLRVISLLKVTTFYKVLKKFKNWAKLL
jgi:hypothetical protein